MGDDECRHGLAAGTCSLCVPKKPRPRPVITGEVEARYEGHCPVCHDAIEVGDTIYRVDDEWVCEGCV